MTGSKSRNGDSATSSHFGLTVVFTSQAITECTTWYSVNLPVLPYGSSVMKGPSMTVIPCGGNARSTTGTTVYSYCLSGAS